MDRNCLLLAGRNLIHTYSQLKDKCLLLYNDGPILRFPCTDSEICESQPARAADSGIFKRHPPF